MTSAYDRYRAADLDLPEGTWAWNVYGAGEENMGKDDQPELLPIPEPDADHMLVRIDSVGLCFSDVKILRAGGSHPKLYNRDLSKEPTRLGHEVSLTVIEVGDNLKDRYHPGQRLAVQPDIYQDVKSRSAPFMRLSRERGRTPGVSAHPVPVRRTSRCSPGRERCIRRLADWAR